MDATTTLSTILARIKQDFPNIKFRKGIDFSWNPKLHTISYKALSSHQDLSQLLHEVAHAKLNHARYQYDIELIEIERSAWEYAVNILAPKYNLKISMDDYMVQDFLDSYRDWLHKRSLCPQCGAVGLQSSDKNYRCLNCHTKWQVNQAKSCQLKRYQIK